MKHQNWFNFVEYCLLIGSGVGSIATAASQQILFTAAPVSAVLLLNLVNRRRLEVAAQENTLASATQLDQKFSNEIGSLQKQVQALPSLLDLSSLRKAVLQTHDEDLAGISAELAQLKRDLEKPDWRILHRSVRQLQQQYSSVSDSVAKVTNQLNRLSVADKTDRLDQSIAQLRAELGQLRIKLDGVSEEQKLNSSRLLQDQINHLNRRLNQIPTPFDATALKQDINSLVKVVGELASRRELSQVSAQVEKLTQQNQALEQSVVPLRLATSILRKQLDTIATRLSVTEEADVLAAAQPHTNPEVIESLQATIAALESRLNQLPDPDELANLNHWRSDVQGMVSLHLEPLQQQLETVQQFTQTLEHQQHSLREWVNHLPQLLDSSALQAQMKSLTTRVEWAENQSEVQAQIDSTIQQRLSEILAQQPVRSAPAYELVFEVKDLPPSIAAGWGSRAILEQTLAEAEARVVLVYPYPRPDLSLDLIQTFRAFLERQGCLDVGWGHLGDLSQGHTPRPIHRRRAIDPIEQSFLYDILHQLTQLKRQYPTQFRFKVLGTDENFLVCDRSYAVLGTQSLATASAIFPQAAVGLRTTDPRVIQDLIDRFDDPALDATDATAFFNRAITRYDLGDCPGAIADYTEVLRIQPDDDVTYNNRALARYDAGDLRGAIADFSYAVHHNPENFIAYCNRGTVRAELGDRLGAIEDHTIAIQMNPDYITAYFCRGVTRTRMQNKLGAIQDYNEVIRLSPQDATAHFYRGLALIKIGHRAEALRDLEYAAERFLEQGDRVNYRQATQALQKLQATLLGATSTEPVVSSGL